MAETVNKIRVNGTEVQLNYETTITNKPVMIGDTVVETILDDTFTVEARETLGDTGSGK